MFLLGCLLNTYEYHVVALLQLQQNVFSRLMHSQIKEKLFEGILQMILECQNYLHPIEILHKVLNIFN